MAGGRMERKMAEQHRGNLLWVRIVERLNLRFPSLFVIFALLTLVDIIVPDVIPLLDEVGLALLTLMFSLWKDRRGRGVPGPRP